MPEIAGQLGPEGVRIRGIAAPRQRRRPGGGLAKCSLQVTPSGLEAGTIQEEVLVQTSDQRLEVLPEEQSAKATGVGLLDLPERVPAIEEGQQDGSLGGNVHGTRGVLEGITQTEELIPLYFQGKHLKSSQSGIFLLLIWLRHSRPAPC
jgi:hypothetical protein